MKPIQVINDNRGTFCGRSMDAVMVSQLALEKLVQQPEQHSGWGLSDYPLQRLTTDLSAQRS